MGGWWRRLRRGGGGGGGGVVVGVWWWENCVLGRPNGAQSSPLALFPLTVTRWSVCGFLDVCLGCSCHTPMTASQKVSLMGRLLLARHASCNPRTGRARPGSGACLGPGREAHDPYASSGRSPWWRRTLPVLVCSKPRTDVTCTSADHAPPQANRPLRELREVAKGVTKQLPDVVQKATAKIDE